MAASLWIAAIFVVELLLLAAANAEQPRQMYHQLLQHINDRNISSEIPPLLQNGTIPVEVRFHLQRIISLHSSTSTLTLAGDVELIWRDQRFMWSSNGTGQNLLFLPVARVWLPPIELADSTKFNHRFGRMNHLDQVLVMPDGLCSFRKRLSFDVSCKINVKYFPWDVQRCDMTFQATPPYWKVVTPSGPLGLNKSMLDSLSEEWDIRATRRTINKKLVPNIRGGPDLSIEVYVVSFLLSRHGMFFVFTIIIPTIMLALVTMVPYIMPPALTGQKMLIPVSTFLSFNIYMLLLERSMPKASELPVIGQCYAILLAVGAMTEIMQGISVKFYNCHLKTIPKPLVFIYLRLLGSVCCIGTCHGMKHLESDEIQDENKRGQTLKSWQTMGRINDRVGLFVSSCITSVVFIYLFSSCYADSNIVDSYYVKDH